MGNPQTNCINRGVGWYLGNTIRVGLCTRWLSANHRVRVRGQPGQPIGLGVSRSCLLQCRDGSMNQSCGHEQAPNPNPAYHVRGSSNPISSPWGEIVQGGPSPYFPPRSVSAGRRPWSLMHEFTRWAVKDRFPRKIQFAGDYSIFNKKKENVFLKFWKSIAHRHPLLGTLIVVSVSWDQCGLR